jgi:D-alanyl-D-alanine carboxypeptidase
MRIASLLIAVLCWTMPLAAAELTAEQKARLLSAYPDHLKSIEDDTLVWRDGTRMPLDDGKGTKPFEEWLAGPDIEDMLAVPYASGTLATPPPKNVDPGRARNQAFFDKVYGDCRKGEVAKNMATVVWLPKKSGQRLRFAKSNGAAAALQAVSNALDALPAGFDRYLIPSAGTYNCRTIAGTNRVSAHGHGVAIDIAVKQSDYWRWSKPGRDGTYPYKNKIPMEIVRIFEQHGFIWGGKWHHYDTMHFEYRPELAGRGK